MPSILSLTDSGGKYLMDGTVIFPTDTMKVALLTSAYTPRPGAPAWNGASSFASGTIIYTGGLYHECVVPGFTGGAMPLFSTVVGGLTVDNTVTWYCWGYMPPPSQGIWADVSAHEVVGAGYTAGGYSLTGKAVTAVNRQVNIAADTVSWTGATITARYAAIYKLGTANSVVNPLVAVLLLNPDNTDNVTSAATLTILWSANGIFTFNQRSQ